MPPGKYECSLDQKTAAKALQELGETPDIRHQELLDLYDWVLSETKLTCPTDPLFLLRYLRASKFEQKRAQERLTNHVSLLTRRRKWFGHVDTQDPAIQAVLDSRHVLYLPGLDDEDQKVILYRLGSFDPCSPDYDKAAIMRTFTALFLHQIQDEGVQVNGFVYLLDASQFGLKHQFFWNVKDLMLIAKLWQNALPCRFKAFHFYNIGVVFETIFRMLLPFLSKKFKERIFIHRNMDSVYDHVPKRLLPLEYLPEHYTGAHAGTLDELLESTKQQITEPTIRDRLLYETGDCMGVSET